MKNAEELTQKTLKELLHYNPLTGIFTWKQRPVSIFNHCKSPDRACNIWNTRYANREAGTIWTSKTAKTYYLIISISTNEKTKRYQAHRLAILYSDGYFPATDVDHIDGNGLNNCRINLREVTAGENHQNMPMSSTNTSGQVGVSWHKPTQKWLVHINADGKTIHGGLFTNKSDAIAKRKQLELEHGYHKNHGRKIKP